MSLSDGTLVEVTTGDHKGMIGNLVGEPGPMGVGIQDPDTRAITPVPYPSKEIGADQLLQQVSQPA